MDSFLAYTMHTTCCTYVVDGEASDFVRVKSRVPQGTVLGPLMFLLYINDISENLTYHIRLFADDCIMYRPIISTEDSLHLQKDLDRVIEWTQHWQMQLNIHGPTMYSISLS